VNDAGFGLWRLASNRNRVFRRKNPYLVGVVSPTGFAGVDSVAIGFVLISTAPAKEHEVYTELLRVKGIVELHPLFGEYDLIAKVEADDFNALGQLVVDKIRSVPGVIDTKTLTGIKF
jgi:DNA-binding Lrp family transcriptional regulator